MLKILSEEQTADHVLASSPLYHIMILWTGFMFLKSTLLLFYQTLEHPHTIFALSAWGNTFFLPILQNYNDSKTKHYES